MQPWEVDQDLSSPSELLSRVNSVGFGELSKCQPAFRDLPLSCSLPAHSLPLFVPIFPRSASSSPNAHSRPCAVTFPVGTGLFLPLIQLPHPWVPAFGTAGPCCVHLQEILPSPPAVAVELVPGKRSGQTPCSEPNAHQCHVLHGVQSCCSVQGLCGVTLLHRTPGQGFALCVQESWTQPWVFQLQT